MKTSSPKNTTLALIDLENLLGSNRDLPTKELRPHCLALKKALGILGPRVRLVFGTGPSLAERAGCLITQEVFPGSRFVLGRGVDGADHALLEAESIKGIARQYSRVIFCSGDGIFTGLALRLALQGLDVGVLARPSSLSARLRKAARWVMPFEDIPMDFSQANCGPDLDEIS